MTRNIAPPERPALGLVPGLMDDAYLWTHQVKHFAEVAQPAVADITAEERIEAMARSVLDQAPDRFALAGFSLDGSVSLALMRLVPERVQKLALLCASARPDTPARREERRTHMADVADDPASDERVIRNEIALVIHPERVRESAFAEAIVTMALRQGPAVYARQNRACMARPDSRPSFPAILCPTPRCLHVVGSTALTSSASARAAAMTCADWPPRSRTVTGHHFDLQTVVAIEAEAS